MFRLQCSKLDLKDPFSVLIFFLLLVLPYGDYPRLDLQEVKNSRLKTCLSALNLQLLEKIGVA